MFKLLVGLLIIFPSLQCAQKAQKKKSLEAVVAGAHRSEESRKRDPFRHPVETLRFFDVRPEMSVIEVSPGSGWYTEIIGPYLTGKFYLAAFSDDSEREYFRNANKKLKEKMAENQDLYGDIAFTVLEMPDKIGPLAPRASVDRVLTFRNVHNWMKAGKAEAVFKEFHRVLKEGGILGVVEHRAGAKSKRDSKAESGYVHTQQVIDLAKAAGFTLLEKSEINANPKDTAEHPKGVWTLPPRLALEDKDKQKYTDIGESDRMTLKFVK